jgi:thermitase
MRFFLLLCLCTNFAWGARVVVIDTGVDSTHPHLKENIKYSYDVSASQAGVTDLNGHGTHIAGIIKTIDPKVELYIIKYLDEANPTQALDNTIKAFEKALELKPDIINYSAGGKEPSLKELKILKLIEEKGIIVVCAAGNERKNLDESGHTFYPASYNLKNIISVASIDKNMSLSSFTNYGDGIIDLKTYGERIRSSLPKGRYGCLSGSSQATAVATGLLSKHFNSGLNSAIQAIKSVRQLREIASEFDE